MRYDTAAICAGVQSGDQHVREKALEDLYQLIHKITWFWLLREVADRGWEDAEDIEHDVYILVLEAIQKGDVCESERLGGFISTINHRRIARNIGRQIQDRRNVLVEEKAGSEILCSVFDQHSPEFVTREAENQRIAQAAFTELDPAEREILIRHYIRRHSQEQICQEMHLTANQFRIRKSRAKIKLTEIVRGIVDGKNRMQLLKRIAA